MCMKRTGRTGPLVGVLLCLGFTNFDLDQVEGIKQSRRRLHRLRWRGAAH